MFVLNYAYKSISRRKQKNITITLAIALGVALYVGVQIGNNGLLNSVARIQYDSIHDTDLYLRPIEGNYIPENLTDLLNTITSKNLISGMERRIEFTTSAFFQSSIGGQIEDNVLVTGIDPNEDLLENFDQFYSIDGEKILLASILNTKTGDLPNVIGSKELQDELLVSGTGDENVLMSFNIGNGTFSEITVNVKDIFDDQKARGMEGTNSADPVSHLYIHLDILHDLMIPSLKDKISNIALHIDGVDRSIESIDYNTGDFPGKRRIEQVMSEIEQLLVSEGIDNMQVYSPRIIIAENVINMVGVTSVLQLFVFILNSIALLLIVNVQLMSVEDRKNQTAVLRALGADRRAIVTIFLIEASFVGIIGGIVGVLLGIPLSGQIVSLIASIFSVPKTGGTIDPLIIFPAMIIGLVLSVITAVQPALQSTKEVIANSLRGIPTVKKPRKGYFTVFFGVIFTVIGLLSAANVGKFWTKEGWQTFDDIQSIGLSLGLTLAGVGMLLTIFINRRIGLNISAISLWGLAIFILEVGISWVDLSTGSDPGNTLTFVMFYCIIGATLLISQNYEFLMKSLNLLLSVFPKLRPISQVTTTGMIGRKTRGILVFTIFSIILTLNVFVISTAESIRVGLVEDHNWRSDGIDVVASIQSPIKDLTEDIKALDSSISHVYGFRKTFVPFYTIDISVPNIDYDPQEHMSYIPVIEVDQSIMNPDNWGSNSLKISLFGALTGSENGAVLDSFEGIGTNQVKNREDSAKFFDNFFEGKEREVDVTYDLKEGRQTIQTEKQVMIYGGRFVEYFGLPLGQSLYMQAKEGKMNRMYIGANGFDMMGSDDMFGIGVLVTPEIASTIPAFDLIPNPNLYLVRSSNGFNDDSNNEQLANTIEGGLNDIQKFGLLLGANTRIVKDEVVEYNFEQAGFWDFLGIFSSLGLIIGTIGMSIIAVRSVSERIREIGMMRSIGFSRKSVVYGVVIELVVLSFLGLIIGIINGILFTHAIVRNIFQTSESFPVTVITLYTLGVILISIIAAIIPGYSASRVAPSQALRYTG